MTTPTEGAACARTRIAGAGDAPTGELRIRAGRVGGRSTIVDAYRTAPFHLGMPSERAGAAELIVQGVGPGYLPGDRLSIDITVDAGAKLTVRGQSATKLYPSPRGEPAVADVRLTVGAGARLTYLPGELIPFRQSILRQVTRIAVEPGGHCVLGEIVTPGRIAMGEVDAYTHLRLDVEASLGGRLVLAERARLEPSHGSLTSIGRHGPHAVAGSLYVIGEPWTAPDDDAISDAVLWASATGDGYTLIRLLGPTAQVVSSVIKALVP
jgi:urease accessory protein